HHGPHPQARLAQATKTETDEYAVMLDGLNPLHLTPAGEAVDWKEYWKSWLEDVKKPAPHRPAEAVKAAATAMAKPGKTAGNSKKPVGAKPVPKPVEGKG
ncbi:MAG TPA: hypothetical protein VI546_02770, partial [candidate division Zixibacteria bacterium]|nr:hypothetical protein [candidate division Zixibacteria bacterium]